MTSPNLRSTRAPQYQGLTTTIINVITIIIIVVITNTINTTSITPGPSEQRSLCS